MGILDFREIPSASAKNRKARKKDLKKEELDAFEKFAEEYFESIRGGALVSRTSRGPDNDLDLCVLLNGQRTLVSCKHYADSDKSVGADDEYDPLSAMYSNNCKKFIGFYSTVPSSGLITKLEGLKNNPDLAFDYEILKNSDIESRLLDADDAVGWLFAARHFPKSYANLFRRFVVPIEHYKERDLKARSKTSWSLDGPYGGISSGGKASRKKFIDDANDALTSCLHGSFFNEALKDAIDAFPQYFQYRVGADLNALSHGDVAPAWDEPLIQPPRSDCNVPIIVSGIWSFWDRLQALEKYLIFADAYDLHSKTQNNPNVIKAKARKQLFQSSILTAGSLAGFAAGKYRDILARLTAFCPASFQPCRDKPMASFQRSDGQTEIWKFKDGEGLDFVFKKLLDRT